MDMATLINPKKNGYDQISKGNNYCRMQPVYSWDTDFYFPNDIRAQYPTGIKGIYYQDDTNGYCKAIGIS